METRTEHHTQRTVNHTRHNTIDSANTRPFPSRKGGRERGRELAPFLLGVDSTQLTCKPALAERETAFAFALPESLPAFPPACYDTKITINSHDLLTKIRPAHSQESIAHEAARSAGRWPSAASKTRRYSPLCYVGPRSSLDTQCYGQPRMTPSKRRARQMRLALRCARGRAT